MKWSIHLSSCVKIALGLMAGLYISAGAESAKPDILLMVADDLNCDSLGYMGGE